jgi:large subunit ribosomal protein L34
MSMASLAVSGAGRGVTAARMGRAAASKGAVAGSSAFFPAKASAKMTMKSSLAGACAPIPRTNAKPGTRGDATARATATREATAFRERAEPPRARFQTSTARRTPARGPRVSGKSVASGTVAFSLHEAFSTRILSFILHPRLVTHDTKHAFVVLTSRSSHHNASNTKQQTAGVVVPRAVAARKPVGGRGALVVVAGGRSIGCTLQGTRRARARTSGFRARLATPGGRRTLKLRRKKGRKYLAPAGAPNMWNKAKRKNLK